MESFEHLCQEKARIYCPARAIENDRAVTPDGVPWKLDLKQNVKVRVLKQIWASAVA